MSPQKNWPCHLFFKSHLHCRNFEPRQVREPASRYPAPSHEFRLEWRSQTCHDSICKSENASIKKGYLFFWKILAQYFERALCSTLQVPGVGLSPCLGPHLLMFSKRGPAPITRWTSAADLKVTSKLWYPKMPASWRSQIKLWFCQSYFLWSICCNRKMIPSTPPQFQLAPGFMASNLLAWKPKRTYNNHNMGVFKRCR